MNGNISKYLKLSDEDYLGYEVNVTVPEPTDFDVNEKILQILCANKSKTAENNGLWVVPLAAPIDNGWIVRIWYRGYTIDEDGNQVEFDGGCNFTASEPEKVEIGKGKFIPGFESGLIGKLITDYSTFTYNTSGFVESHDIVVVTMTAMYPDGKSESIKSGRIDLTDDKFEERWGSGLKEALIGKEIGKTYSENVLSEMSDGTAMYSDIKISSTVRPTMPCTEGSYQKDERVTVEYTVTKPGEEPETETCAPFTLNQYAIGGMFGTGVVSDLMHALLYSTDKTIGTPVNVSYTDEDGVIYSNPRVVSVHKREDNPIVVQGQFPYNYKEESLRGKTAYFFVRPLFRIFDVRSEIVYCRTQKYA